MARACASERSLTLGMWDTGHLSRSWWATTRPCSWRSHLKDRCTRGGFFAPQAQASGPKFPLTWLLLGPVASKQWRSGLLFHRVSVHQDRMEQVLHEMVARGRCSLFSPPSWPPPTPQTAGQPLFGPQFPPRLALPNSAPNSSFTSVFSQSLKRLVLA